MTTHETASSGLKTFSVAEVAAALAGDSMRDPQRWLTRQITSGRFTARKVGRSWRMTQADVDHALAVMANADRPARTEPAPAGQPSVGSMRRRRIA